MSNCEQCVHFRRPNLLFEYIQRGIGTYGGNISATAKGLQDMARIEIEEIEFARKHGYLPERPMTVDWCAYLSKNKTRIHQINGAVNVYIPCLVVNLDNNKTECPHFKMKEQFRKRNP